MFPIKIQFVFTLISCRVSIAGCGHSGHASYKTTLCNVVNNLALHACGYGHDQGVQTADFKLYIYLLCEYIDDVII